MIRQSLGPFSAIHVVALVFGPGSAIAQSHTPSSATTEALGVVPSDMAACLIVEDLASRLEQVRSSSLLKRVRSLPGIKKWEETERVVEKIAVLKLGVSASLGMSYSEIVEGILGGTVVLAFRPGEGNQPRDEGLLVCRAADEKLLARLFDALTAKTGRRSVESLTSHGVTFFERREDNKVDYLVRLGAVAAFSDQRAVIERVIESSHNQSGLGDLPEFKAIAAALPPRQLATLIVRPSSFQPRIDRIVEGSGAAERHMAALVRDWFRALDWFALTLSFDNEFSIGLHVATAGERLLPAARKWAQLPEPNSIWNRIPDDVLLALAGHCDLTVIARFLDELASISGGKDFADAKSVAQQLFAGFELNSEVLPRLGPAWGIVVYPAGAEERPGIAAVLEYQEREPRHPGEVPLSKAIESVAHPFLVLVGFGMNKERNETWTAALQTFESGLRIHSLRGSREHGPRLEPSFAIFDGFIVLANRPSAIGRWFEPPDASPSERGKPWMGKRALPEDYSPRAYVNLAAAAAILERRAAPLAQTLTEKDGNEETARAALTTISGCLRLLDRAVVGTRLTNGVRHWILKVAPADIKAEEPRAGSPTSP